MRDRIAALTLLLSACAGSSTRQDARATAESLNVIVIMTDDQGWGDFGFHGNPLIQTPNLDALASRSARMQTFYVSPVCAPTRAALMTGRWCQRTRAIDTYIGRAMMEPEEVTVAEVLRDAGWATGIFGKWHLGDCYPMRPMDQGFEESLVHRGGGIGQPSDPEGGERAYTDAVLFRRGQRVETVGYCTDVYFDAALDFVRTSHASGRPFFTYLATNAPHGPFDDVPLELYEQYAKADLAADRFPSDRGHALPEEHDEDRLARIFAMITNIDQNVGRLIEQLEELGILENTLVLFLVDNGPNTRRYVGGMRGMKASVHEGGVRSPLLAHWPARLSPDTISDRISAHVDVMPTVLDACGVALPAGVRLDGRSLLPLLADADAEDGESLDWPDRDLVIQAHRGDRPVRYHNFMLRTQRWKLLNDSGFGRELLEVEPDFELYDMAADPLELADLAAERPEVVADLRARYDAWFDDVCSTRPDNFAPPRIVLGAAQALEVHLTRQDWRRIGQDGGRAAGSLGEWEVQVVGVHRHQVRVRFPRGAQVRRVELRLGPRVWSAVPAPGATEHRFEGLFLPAGPGSLRVTLETVEGLRGAYQVVLTRSRNRFENS